MVGTLLAHPSIGKSTPFALLTGIALMFGYSLLGAGWLILKTEGDLQQWARRAGTGVFNRGARRDPRRKHLDPDQQCRYRTALVHMAEYRFSGTCSGYILIDRRRRVVCADATTGVDAISGRDRFCFNVIYRHRDQPVADDRAFPLHPGGGLLQGAHRPSC